MRQIHQSEARRAAISYSVLREILNFNRKRCVLVAVSGACIGMSGAAARAKLVPVVTLSLDAANGQWDLFASDSNDNAGIVDFAIDVTGSDGITIASSHEDVPFFASGSGGTYPGANTGGSYDYGDPGGFNLRNVVNVSGGVAMFVAQTSVAYGGGMTPRTTRGRFKVLA